MLGNGRPARDCAEATTRKLCDHHHINRRPKENRKRFGTIAPWAFSASTRQIPVTDNTGAAQPNPEFRPVIKVSPEDCWPAFKTSVCLDVFTERSTKMPSI